MQSLIFINPMSSNDHIIDSLYGSPSISGLRHPLLCFLKNSHQLTFIFIKKIKTVTVVREGMWKQGCATSINWLKPSFSTNLKGSSSIIIIRHKTPLHSSWSNYIERQLHHHCYLISLVEMLILIV